MGFFFTGGFMAVQGLWASRWMNVLEGLERAAVAERLTVMGSTMLAGFIAMGFFATALVRRGIRLETVYSTAMFVALCSFGLICLYPTQVGYLLWPVLATAFSLSNISYSLVAQAFPTALSGRANTALNLLVFAGAFGLQWGIGIYVDALQAAGWNAETAYRTAFLSLLAGQALAYLWLRHRGRKPDPA